MWYHRPVLAGKPVLAVATTKGSGLRKTLSYLESMAVQWGAIPAGKVGRSIFTQDRPVSEKELKKLIRLLQIPQEHTPTLSQLLNFEVQKAMALSLTQLDREYWEAQHWNDQPYFYSCKITTAFAQRIEKAVFPNDLHFKIALTGCPNDCAKVRMHDFGIMGMTVPQFEPDRCVSCGACVKACKKKSVEALTPVNFRPQREARRCIGCGECVLACPNAAWTRSDKKYYRLTLLGRTGKKNPRLGEDFIKWVDEDSIIKIILNTYDYVKEYIDPNAPGGKEHIGYIVDRTGFEEFKRWALRDVTLPDIAEVMTPMYWKGVKY